MAGNREAIIEQVTALAERLAASSGLEVAQVELAGGGRNRVLRISIDRPPAPGERVPIDQPFGVTLEDCEQFSHGLGTLLDEQDVIPGEEGYQLEVGSPGVERKLVRPIDFERFCGHKMKIRLREPVEKQKVWRGRLAAFDGAILSLEATYPEKRSVQIEFARIDRANVEIDW
jgi:ribosome maturation factor RimP